MSVNEGEKPVADKKFEVLDGSSETSRTYIFGDEDHTLGNSLRHVLMQRRVHRTSLSCHTQLIARPTTRSADTSFCGYSVPHPSEPKMHIRLQTHGERHSVAPALALTR